MTDAAPILAPGGLAAMCHVPDDATAEALRALAVRLDVAFQTAGPEVVPDRSASRSIIVTSIENPAPVVACRLAGTLAASGWPTCLVEVTSPPGGRAGDEVGLADWLAGGSDALIRQVETDIARLTLVPGGRQALTMAERLRIDDVRRLTTLLSGVCRRIVWAGPPLTAAGGMAVAGGVNGVVLVVSPERLRREAARRAKEAIASSGGTLLGIVLSNE
jgi:Mrp family chromosome partitioning ATPase